MTGRYDICFFTLPAVNFKKKFCENLMKFFYCGKTAIFPHTPEALFANCSKL